MSQSIRSSAARRPPDSCPASSMGGTTTHVAGIQQHSRAENRWDWASAVQWVMLYYLYPEPHCYGWVGCRDLFPGPHRGHGLFQSFWRVEEHRQASLPSGTAPGGKAWRSDIFDRRLYLHRSLRPNQRLSLEPRDRNLGDRKAPESSQVWSRCNWGFLGSIWGLLLSPQQMMHNHRKWSKLPTLWHQK